MPELKRINMITVTDAEESTPWPHKPMTLKRCIALFGLWCVCLIMPIVAIILGALFGAIKGMGAGAYDGLSDAYRDLKRWYDMFEDS